MRRFLACLLLVFFLVPCAQADRYPYPEDAIVSVLPLTDSQRALANFLYQPVFNGEARIDLPPGTRYEDVSFAMSSLMQDYPELFNLDKLYTIGYYTITPELASWIEPTYRMDAGEAAALRAELYAKAYLITSSGGTPQAVHDLLCEGVVYGGSTELRHTAVGALLQGTATCEGYAQALTLLYRMMGVPCGVISGDAMDSQGSTDRHSWNIARMNGWTLIDATWNDQDGLGVNTHWYYGLSTRQMGADHFPDAEQRIPECGEQDNWHTVNGCVVHTQAEADAAIRRLVAGEAVNLRIPSQTLYAQLAHDAFSWLGDYNQRCPEAAFYGAYSISSCDAQQCVLLQRAD